MPEQSFNEQQVTILKGRLAEFKEAPSAIRLELIRKSFHDILKSMDASMRANKEATKDLKEVSFVVQ